MTDQQQLARYAESGDPEAFGSLVARYLGMVTGVALRRCGDRGLAEEAAQNTFAILARKARRLAAHPTVAGWLHRTAHFEAGRLLRSERNRQAAMRALADNLARQSESAASALPDPALREALDRALARLAPSDRDVLLLRYFEGLSFREVGERMGKGEAAAQKQAERALARMRGTLRRAGSAAPGVAVAGALAAHLTSDVTTSGAQMATTRAALAAASFVSSASLVINTLITMSQLKLTLAATAALILLAALPIASEFTRRAELKTQFAALVPEAEPSAARSEITSPPVRRAASQAGEATVANSSEDGAKLSADRGAPSEEEAEAPADPAAMAVDFGTRMGAIKREEFAFRQRYASGPPAADSAEFETYVADMDALARFSAKTMADLMRELEKLEDRTGENPLDGDDSALKALWLAAVLGSSVGLEAEDWMPLMPVLERANGRRLAERLRGEDRDPADATAWDERMRKLTDDVLAEIAAGMGADTAARIREVNGSSFLHSFNMGIGAPVKPSAEGTSPGH